MDASVDAQEGEEDDERKIVLKRRIAPKVVTLPNGTTFTGRYERINRKSLPSNIKVKKVRKIGARNRNNGPLSVGDLSRLKKISTKRRVRFNLTSSALKKLRRRRRAQTGSGLASNLASLGLNMRSKAINSVLGKKLINKGIDSIPSVFKYGVSKIKNKNVQRALNSDIGNYVVDEAKNIVRAK